VKSTHFSADAGDQTTSAAKAGMLALINWTFYTRDVEGGPKGT